MHRTFSSLIVAPAVCFLELSLIGLELAHSNHHNMLKMSFKTSIRCSDASFVSSQAGTWVKAQTYQGIYASWAVLLLLVLVTLARAFYWACMRVSQPLQNFT